jgi:hypothetical protein
VPTDPPLTWYTFVKDFQALVGTLVGFGGVCLTLWANARVTEVRRADEIGHDRNAVRVMLLAELSNICVQLKEWQEVLDDVAREKQIALPRSFDAEASSRAYRAALPKVGLLSESEIQQAALAYSRYENLSKNSHEMQKWFDPEKMDDIMRLEFRAYIVRLKSTIAAINAAVEGVEKAKAIDTTKDRIRKSRWLAFLRA